MSLAKSLRASGLRKQYIPFRELLILAEHFLYHRKEISIQKRSNNRITPIIAPQYLFPTNCLHVHQTTKNSTTMFTAAMHISPHIDIAKILSLNTDIAQSPVTAYRCRAKSRHQIPISPKILSSNIDVA